MHTGTKRIQKISDRRLGKREGLATISTTMAKLHPFQLLSNLSKNLALADSLIANLNQLLCS
jgi:hypothetical protein